MENYAQNFSLQNNNFEIKKKLQTQANFYLEILEVLQKLESQGRLNELINCFRLIHLEEHERITNGLKCLENQGTIDENNENYMANSQIFKKNFLLILDILVEEIWGGNSSTINHKTLLTDGKNIDFEQKNNKNMKKKPETPPKMVFTPVKRTKEIKIVNKIYNNNNGNIQRNEEAKIPPNSDQKAPVCSNYTLKRKYSSKNDKIPNKTVIKSETSLLYEQKNQEDFSQNIGKNSKECQKSINYKSLTSLGSLKGLEKIESEFSYLKISGKFSKDKRKIAEMTENNENRGPGLYDIDKGDVRLSQNKNPQAVVFGKSPRSSQFDKSKEEHSPGPGAYNPSKHYVTK